MGGCAAQRREAEKKLPLSVTDPVAVELHELCGAVLQYYAATGSLPATLAPLGRRLYGEEEGEKKVAPYRYFNPPLPLAGRPGSLLVLAPREPGLTLRGKPARWAILISPIKPGSPLTTQVVRVWEEEVRSALQKP